MAKSERPILAWHFLPAGGRLRYGDGREPKDGEWLRAYRAPSLCNGGMHASRKLTDALTYAPGLTLCRVQVRGDVVEGDDKLAGWERRILWRIDAREAVVAFARGCAERARGYAAAADADAAAGAAAYASAATYADAAASASSGYADYADYAASAAAYAARAADYAAGAAAYAAYYADHAEERRIQEREFRRLVRAARKEHLR